MKKLMIGGWLSVAALAVMAGVFPYGTDMAVRHEKESAEVSSFTTPVEIPAVDGGMPATDSVATLFASVVDFCASDDENWQTGVDAIGSAQAALLGGSIASLAASCVSAPIRQAGIMVIFN